MNPVILSGLSHHLLQWILVCSFTFILMVLKLWFQSLDIWGKVKQCGTCSIRLKVIRYAHPMGGGQIKVKLGRGC